MPEMLLTLSTPAASYPVTLAEAKAQLRGVTHTDDDTLISALIGAACATVSRMAGRALSEETWVCAVPYVSGDLALPVTPLLAVTSIDYWDADGVDQAATLSDFFVFKDEDTATIRPKDGKAWPSTQTRLDAIRVTFTAGYETLPENLRQAILLLVSHYYGNSLPVAEGKMEELPFAVQHLVGLSRRGWFGG